jgi:hypothetical protein
MIVVNSRRRIRMHTCIIIIHKNYNLMLYRVIQYHSLYCSVEYSSVHYRKRCLVIGIKITTKYGTIIIIYFLPSSMITNTNTKA